MKLGSFTGDINFKNIGVGNIQWIAGLNAGITCESFKGCVFWTGFLMLLVGLAH